MLGVSLLTITAGVLVLLVGEAAHGAGSLVYVGGYLALAYLVYAAVLDLASAALSGLLGLGSCLSCLPIVGSLAAGLAGGTGVVAAFAALSVDVSTAVFVASVALLALRPGFDSHS
jgi:hypothetical protein